MDSTDSADRYLFRLPKDFVTEYAKKTPPFGFNGLGEVTYRRSYSRLKEDGTNEEWYETVERVVNGTYTMMHTAAIKNEHSPWIEDKAQKSAKKMYDKMFHMKFLPPGRGLYAMGTKITDNLQLYASLNNCGFVSTQELWECEPKEQRTKPFEFLMLMSMMGVGVGFDVKGKGSFSIHEPETERKLITVHDSREGWVSSTMLLLQSYFCSGKKSMVFDYSKIRPKGTPLKTFGGIAPGPAPLKKLHDSLMKILDAKIDKPIDTNLITDIMNLIGTCVVAGGVRRTAEIALGDMNDRDFIHLKDFGTYRSEWMWTSNNSVCLPTMNTMPEGEAVRDLLRLTLRTAANGEPGYYWLDNMQDFARMNRSMSPEDPMTKYDTRREPSATGTNPCAEQTLESYELCCLVETFPHLHATKEEYIQTLKYAYLYAKVVTTGMTQWKDTNLIIQRNRRVGCSMTGVAQFVDTWGRKRVSEAILSWPKVYREFMDQKLEDIIRDQGREELISWCEDGYRAIRNWDITYSNWMNIPESVKVTSIKPSGTVSLLGGATPGMHWPIERYYKRRIRINDSSPLLPVLKKAGYHIEKDTYADNTMVVEFPVYCGSESIQRESEVSAEDQMAMAALLQRHWADNQVSVTIKFWKVPTLEEASEFTSLLAIAFAEHVEDLKYLLSSRKVMLYSGEKNDQEAMDQRWAKMDPIKIQEMLCVVAAEFGNLYRSTGPTRMTLLRKYFSGIREDEMEKQAKMLRGIIAYHMEMYFSVELAAAHLPEGERENEERITDILTLVKAVHIAMLLREYSGKLKAVSFLPMETGVYAQAPYERINEVMYEDMVAGITPITHWDAMPQPEQPIGCDGDSCEKPTAGPGGGTLAHSST